MTLDTLKTEIEKLTPQQLRDLAEWLLQREEEAWDDQIRSDFRAGKLDKLIREAERELDDGSIREAP